MSKLLIITFSFYIIFIDGLSGQQFLKQMNLDVGVSTLPLTTKRTNLTRWMMFPSIDLSYSLNETMSIAVSYMYKDIRKYDNSKKYIEAPDLTSYEEAVNFIGFRISLPYFRNYIFFGVNKKLLTAKWFNLSYGGQIGYRTGEYLVLNAVSYHPSFPNGFERHSTFETSRGPGLNLKLLPSVHFGKSFYLRLSVGTYLFTKWPEIQPYWSLKVGVSL